MVLSAVADHAVWLCDACLPSKSACSPPSSRSFPSDSTSRYKKRTQIANPLTHSLHPLLSRARAPQVCLLLSVVGVSRFKSTTGAEPRLPRSSLPPRVPRAGKGGNRVQRGSTPLHLKVRLLSRTRRPHYQSSTFTMDHGRVE